MGVRIYEVGIVDRNGMPQGTCEFAFEQRVPEGEERLAWSARVLKMDGRAVTNAVWTSFSGAASEAFVAFEEQFLARYRPAANERRSPAASLRYRNQSVRGARR